MAKPYKPRPPGSLKEALAALVELAGGQGVVARLWKCSPQNVARMTDDGHAAFPRIDQVIALEKTCGQRTVTDFMAREHACVVEPFQPVCAQLLPIIVGRITSETGELLSAVARDVQQGALTRANAAAVIRETQDVIPALLQLLSAARATLNQGRGA